MAPGAIMLSWCRLRGASAPERRLERERLRGLVLARSLGVGPEKVVVERRCTRCGHASHGKPRLRDSGNLDFSMSSTHALAVVAVASEGPVGVDVEPAAREVDDGVLAVVGARESLTTSDQRLWAWLRGEAGLKALGAGLAGKVTAAERSALARWTYRELALPGDVVACVASALPRAIEVREVSPAA